MITNYHTHTSRCRHALGRDEEFVVSAIKGGYEELGFSDHTPWMFQSNYMSNIRMVPEELPEYVENLRMLKKRYQDRISIKIGLECEYFPEYMDWLKEVTEEQQLDYLIFGNHHYHSEERFPYFGRYCDTPEMLDLYEESSVKGMESGLFAYFAHPDLFMRSYPTFDRNCRLTAQRICRTAARLNLPLEYNLGYEDYNEIHQAITYPHPEFWQIAANEGCTAIIGVDAHEYKELEQRVYYNRSVEALRSLKINTIDRISFLTGK